MLPQVDAALRLAGDHLAARRFSEAHAACLDVLRHDPRVADAWYYLGVIAAEHQNHAKACELFDKAIAIGAPASRRHADKARSLVALFRRDEAAAEAERAITIEPHSARTLDTIGVVFSRLGLHERAAPFFRLATSREPGNAAYWYNLGAALQFMGDFAGAEAAYAKTLALDPRDVRAWSARVLMTRQTRERNHREALEALFATLNGPSELLNIGHALAKTAEDLGDPDAAMMWLDRAKAAKRAEAGHDLVETGRLFDAAAATVNVDAVPPGCPDPSPIFIVGLPRTGTTLIDRILSQHSHVRSAGELSDFALELKRRTGTPSAYVMDPQTLAVGSKVDVAALGAAYVARARRVVGNDTPRFVDKMPLNFFYAPLILRALPNARIICVRRHPLDTVLSNYRQLFATGYSYYGYAHDLGWAADYYARFDRLIASFRTALPPDRFMEVAYEDVVAGIEPEARRLIAFCGLEWEPQCVDFHENAAPVATASSAQVRQPIYATSVGRWRRYLKHLQPAIDVFEAKGIAI